MLKLSVEDSHNPDNVLTSVKNGKRAYEFEGIELYFRKRLRRLKTGFLRLSLDVPLTGF